MNRFRQLGVLAIAGLVIAAASIGYAAPKKSTKSSKTAKKSAPAEEVLVRFGKETITAGDVQRRIDGLPEQYRSNYTTPEGRQQLLDRMVEERLWLSEATKNGVPERTLVRQQIEQQRRDLLIRTYLNELMAKNPAVSDSEAHAYYDAHVNEYRTPATVSVRHIQTKSESDAKKVAQYLKKGQEWNALAKKYSADTLTRNTGGNLGIITRDGAFGALGAQPALTETVFTYHEGQVSGPIKTDRGWHIIRVDQVKPESVRPFDQVKPLIARQLGSQRQQDFYKEQLDDARRRQGVHADSAAIKRFVSQRRTAREMFNDAQALGPPEQRIEAYRKLLAEYPNSDVSPQAQFMIGFIYSEELKDYGQAEQAFRAVLQHYPKAELAPSAQWMIDHMRTDEAPAFIQMNADSMAAPPTGQNATTPRAGSPGSGKTSRAGQR